MIFIAGGAGYIGSHVNKLLSEKNYKTIVFDNLIYGHKEFLKWGSFIEGDLGNLESIREVFQNNQIKAVMHFSSYAYVGESMEDPEKYYYNNVVNTLNLLKVMKEFGVQYFVFSSSCATYGNPLELPIAENHPQNPINPYGQTKLMVEKILFDYSRAYEFKYISLRYFNAAGADPDGLIGEWHNPETHLIPIILDVAMGNRENVEIYGTDYNTEDGTCIRDYIHVNDLSNAHILALGYLFNGGKSEIFNLGNGKGYSVLEVIDCIRKVTGKKISAIKAKRRIGDPAILIGGVKKAEELLGWKQKFSDLEIIIKTAWDWHQRLHKDYL